MVAQVAEAVEGVEDALDEAGVGDAGRPVSSGAEESGGRGDASQTDSCAR